jgi:SHS2 domain-containing protein
MSRKYVYLDHTADVGFRAYGDTVEAVFAHAAEALFDVLTALDQIRPTHQHDLKVEADDLEALMVRWLNELLYRFETEALLFRRFLVNTVENGRLWASCWGETFDPARHGIKTGIKAATYHQIYVTQRGDLWESQVFLDL